jgi:hypothetical protein
MHALRLRKLYGEASKEIDLVCGVPRRDDDGLAGEFARVYLDGCTAVNQLWSQSHRYIRGFM